MPSNRDTHDSTRRRTHAWSPAVYTLHFSQTHTHTHTYTHVQDWTDCLMEAHCCIVVGVFSPSTYLHTHTDTHRHTHRHTQTHTHTGAFTIIQLFSIPRMPDNFTPYSEQQPRADESDRTRRIDWLNASKAKPTKESRGRKKKTKRKKLRFISTLLTLCFVTFTKYIQIGFGKLNKLTHIQASTLSSLHQKRVVATWRYYVALLRCVATLHCYVALLRGVATLRYYVNKDKWQTGHVSLNRRGHSHHD